MSLTRRAVLGAPLVMAAAPLPPAARPIDRLSTPWWKARHLAKLAEAKSRPPGLILLGDSITQNLESAGPDSWYDYRAVWAKHFAPRQALNLGFKGDATSHLLWRMRNGELDGLRPKAAVILIGANNMGRLHWPAEDTVLGIRSVVDDALLRLPGARIVLCAVLPSRRSAWVDETTRTVNAALAKAYARGEVVWHDPTAIFMKGGKLDESLFYDGLLTPPEPPLHPTAAGMARWAESLEPVLRR